MSTLDDDESDWNSSKIKGFSFGDDDETPWAELAKYQSENVATSSLSGFASSNSIKPSESSTSLSRGIGPGVVSDRVKKAVRLYQAAIGEQDGFYGAAGGTSISQAASDISSTDPEYLSNDPRELRAELGRLRKRLAKVELSRYTPLHPKETVRNIFLGKKFSLDGYRSLQDKIDLIEEATKFMCGNAILTVTLFAYRTLSSARFLEIISTQPVALRHLLAHLEERGEISRLSELLTSLGRKEEAALVHYGQACTLGEGDHKAWRIKSVVQNHFHGHPDSALVVAHLNLLERLAPVKAADSKDPGISSGDGPTLTPETVIDTLIYLCFHHYDKGENLLQSPMGFKKMHKLSEQQFIWAALIARARRKAWKDCEALTVTKGWLGGKKVKSVVEPEAVTKLLHQEGAPPDVLQVFLSLTDDSEERERLARRYDVPTVVVDCLVQARDRQGLLRLRDKLTTHSPEWYYAEHALSTSNTKWKN